MHQLPHFYLLGGSLGMKDARRDDQHLNAFVADGPDYLAQHLHLSKYGQVTTLPVINWDKDQDPRYRIIASQYRHAVDLIKETLLPNEIPVVIGGDHSTALPAIIAALHRHETEIKPENFGLLMLDSHTDLHQPETSPSLNFHGMWLRPLLDEFNHAAINDLARPKIPLTNLLFVGDHSCDFEKAEAEFIKKNDLATISREEFQKSPQDAMQKINDFTTSFEHLHITFDLDFITSQEVAVNICNDAGFSSDEFQELVAHLHFPPSFSLSFSEFNPQRQHIKNSLACFQFFLKHFFPQLP